MGGGRGLEGALAPEQMTQELLSLFSKGKLSSLRLSFIDTQRRLMDCCPASKNIGGSGWTEEHHLAIHNDNSKHSARLNSKMTFHILLIKSCSFCGQLLTVEWLQLCGLTDGYVEPRQRIGKEMANKLSKSIQKNESLWNRKIHVNNHSRKQYGKLKSPSHTY